MVYRLYFHPLARYPGPTVGRITDLDSVYHQWRGDRHLDFHKKHQKYGRLSGHYGCAKSCILMDDLDILSCEGRITQKKRTE